MVAWPFDILIGQAGAKHQSKCQAAMLPRQRRNQMIPTFVTPRICRMIVQKLDVFDPADQGLLNDFGTFWKSKKCTTLILTN